MTITDIKAANAAAGMYFFERDTMRFFNSRVERGVYEGPGGVYFVTSEQFIGSQGAEPRKFTVRKFNQTTGGVDTLGEFNEIKHLEDARSAAKIAAKNAGQEVAA